MSVPSSLPENNIPIVVNYECGQLTILDPLTFFRDLFFILDLRGAKNDLRETAICVLGDPAMSSIQAVRDCLSNTNEILSLIEEHIQYQSHQDDPMLLKIRQMEKECASLKKN